MPSIITSPQPGDDRGAPPQLPDLDAWTPDRETPAFKAAVAAELARRGLAPRDGAR